MFDVQSEASVKDQIHTFEVPIKFTRTQLEKMLRAVDADADHSGTYSIWLGIPRFKLPSGTSREIVKPESGWWIWFKRRCSSIQFKLFTRSNA